MQEVISDDQDNEQLLEDAHEVKCAPPSYGNSLVVLTWKDGEGQMVDELASQRCQMKKVSFPPYQPASQLWRNHFSSLKRETISFLHQLYRPVSIRSQHLSAQKRGYSRYTPHATLWFYQHDCQEDIGQWDGKSTLTLEVQVCELQGKMMANGGSPRETAAPVSSGWFSRHRRRVELLILMAGLLIHIYKK